MNHIITTKTFFIVSLIAEIIFLVFLTYCMIRLNSRCFIVWFFVLCTALTHAYLLFTLRHDKELPLD